MQGVRIHSHRSPSNKLVLAGLNPLALNLSEGQNPVNSICASTSASQYDPGNLTSGPVLYRLIVTRAA